MGFRVERDDLMLKLARRDRDIEKNLIFFAMPYEERTMPDGKEIKFQDIYDCYFAEAAQEIGLTPTRADHNHATTESVLQAAWDGIDRAEVVVVDLSPVAREERNTGEVIWHVSTSVAMEMGWAMCLHKKIVVLHYKGSKLPTDLDGQVRAITYDSTPKGLSDLKKSLKASLEEELKQGLSEMDLRPREKLMDVEAIARVEWATVDHIFVRDVSNMERSAELRKADLSWEDPVPESMEKKFRVGTKVHGTFVTDNNGIRFSQRHRVDNPWPARDQAYPRGKVVSAEVTGVGGNGVFLELESGGNPRIPASRAVGVAVGDKIRVRIKGVDAEKRRIDVEIESSNQSPAPSPYAASEYPQRGENREGVIVATVVDRGYVLVEIEGYENLPRPSMLHVNDMSEQLRSDVESGAITKGGRVAVEVKEVSPSHKNPGQYKVRLRGEAIASVAHQADLQEPSVPDDLASWDQQTQEVNE
jgi:hypothetical protein